jgi:predicted PurR-regulated permease PerM
MMIDEKSFNKIAGILLFAILGVLSFLVIRPILLSCIFAMILGFIFYPIHKKLLKVVKNRNLSALIVCLILLLIIIIPLAILTPIFIRQTITAYSYIQKQDLTALLRPILLKIIPADYHTDSILAYVNSSISKIASGLFTKFSDILINTPTILLHTALILFVFFFTLRDGEELVAYIKSLSPLSQEAEKKVFEQSKEVTYSVIYGQIVIGIFQGIAAGIALFILRIPNAFILTVMIVFVSILPLLGPYLILIPVALYLFISGRIASGIILLVYGVLVISTIEHLLKSIIVGKRTKINSGVILVSMIGGLFVFGVLGLILGPLIISYLILVLDMYRKKGVKGLIVKEES